MQLVHFKLILMIQSSSYSIHFQSDGYKKLNELISKNAYSSVFILVDSNSFEKCYVRFIPKLETNVRIEIIEIDPGEEFKNLDTCYGVWKALTELGADRKSLLIALGGGVITDLGGFVAGTYKRGIDFVNIPTTLLSMVDAAVGGKTGVDLGVLKNQIGIFLNPKLIVVDLVYLETLDKREIKSGLAEVIKYALTFDISLLEDIKNVNDYIDSEIIEKSIQIKNSIVIKDPFEKNLRKVLNFGHTIGHAVESYFLENNKKEALKHGEAIAVGMICESYLSCKICGLPENKLTTVKNYISSIFKKVTILDSDLEFIFEYLKHDKKNTAGEINFVLLNDFEKFELDCKVSTDLIKESIYFYNS